MKVKRASRQSKSLLPFKKDVLFKFLKRTKAGKYARIEASSLPYSRIQQQTEIIEDQYIYGLR